MCPVRFRNGCWGFFLLGVLLGCVKTARAQSHGPLDTIRVFMYIDGKDTIPWASLPEVDIYDRLPDHWRRRYAAWNRLRNAVYVTYPYACAAARLLKQVQVHLKGIPDKKARKQYLKSEEKILQQQFGSKIENLSVYQGKVLIKLIYRQTGTDCYDIIKDMRGGFSARFWQTVAFVFGSNLKTPYDVQQDADIEAIVQEIQRDPAYSYLYN